MRIRKAIKKDFKDIAEISKTEFSRPPYYETWSREDSLKKIRDYIKKRSKIFIAEINNEIVGYVIFNHLIAHDGIEVYIDEIVVSKKFQGMKIGYSLFKKIEEDAYRKKSKQISLFVFNKCRAFNFYKKLKFKEDGYISLMKNLK